MAKKILVIDDEIDIMKTMVYRLKAKGYEVFSASNGKEGISVAQTQKPDLILLDLRLPDINGPEVARQIRAEEALRDTPIILITASVDIIGQKIEKCSAVDYILKPIDPEILYKKIEKYIGL